MEEARFGRHFVCLTALFILGESVIGLPYNNSGGYSVLAFIAAAALGFLVLAAGFLLLKFACRFKAAAAFLYLAAAVYALYLSGAAFKEFLLFAAKILLPSTPRFFVAAIFIIVCAYLALKSREILLKLSVLAFPIAAVGIILFFFLSFKDFNTEWLIINRLPDIKEFLRDGAPMALNVSLPFLLLPVLGEYFLPNKRKRAAFSGGVTGILLLALCFFDSILLFGTSLAARCEFPLYSAVSTVTVGPLFTRMDGIVFCLYFLTALIKTSVCLKICVFSMKRVKSAFKN